jgi:hypothetical protein
MGMGYAAIILVLIGFALGALFRLKVLITILALLLVPSIAFSIASGFSFLDTALTVMIVQSITQGSYFLGLVARTVFISKRVRHIL